MLEEWKEGRRREHQEKEEMDMGQRLSGTGKLHEYTYFEAVMTRRDGKREMKGSGKRGRREYHGERKHEKAFNWQRETTRGPHILRV